MLERKALAWNVENRGVCIKLARRPALSYKCGVAVLQAVVNVQLLELCIMTIMSMSEMFMWSFPVALVPPHSSLGDPRLIVC